METLSKAQKYALLNALEIQRNKSGHNNPAWEHLRQFWEFIESFPTSSEGLGDSTSEPSENRCNQDASLTCNQDASLTWIPVTERNPKQYQKVIIVTGDGWYEESWPCIFIGGDFISFGSSEKVPAKLWQPLPPPPTN